MQDGLSDPKDDVLASVRRLVTRTMHELNEDTSTDRGARLGGDPQAQPDYGAVPPDHQTKMEGQAATDHDDGVLKLDRGELQAMVRDILQDELNSALRRQIDRMVQRAVDDELRRLNLSAALAAPADTAQRDAVPTVKPLKPQDAEPASTRTKSSG